MNKLTKPINIEHVISLIDNSQFQFQGDNQNTIDSFSSINNAMEGDLVFIESNDIHYVEKVIKKCKASLILCDIRIYSEIETKQNLLGVENPRSQFCIIVNECLRKEKKSIIHKTAIISDKAKIGKNCNIGPYCVIGDAKLGDNCFIHTGVHILDDVEIGNNVEINSYTVIGEDGFGSYRDEKGEFHPFPQIAGVIIEDSVSISANVTIKKGALQNTRIGSGSHLSSQVNIGHATQIGMNVFIGPSVMVGGSANIENNCNIWTGALIRDGITIGKWSNAAMGSVVTKSFGDKCKLIGIPARNVAE